MITGIVLKQATFFSPSSPSVCLDENMKYMSVYRARNMNLKRISCSESMLNHVGVTPGQPESLSKSCDDLTAKMEARLRLQCEMRKEMSRILNNDPPDKDPDDHWRYSSFSLLWLWLYSSLNLI